MCDLTVNRPSYSCSRMTSFASPMCRPSTFTWLSTDQVISSSIVSDSQLASVISRRNPAFASRIWQGVVSLTPTSTPVVHACSTYTEHVERVVRSARNVYVCSRSVLLANVVWNNTFDVDVWPAAPGNSDIWLKSASNLSKTNYLTQSQRQSLSHIIFDAKNKVKWI